MSFHRTAALPTTGRVMKSMHSISSRLRLVSLARGRSADIDHKEFEKLSPRLPGFVISRVRGCHALVCQNGRKCTAGPRPSFVSPLTQPSPSDLSPSSKAQFHCQLGRVEIYSTPLIVFLKKNWKSAYSTESPISTSAWLRDVPPPPTSMEGSGNSL